LGKPGRKTLDDPGKARIKKSFSLPLDKLSKYKSNVEMSHDDPNRQVESFIDLMNARYEGLPALKVILIEWKREVEWKQDEIKQLEETIQKKEELAKNVERRHNLMGYDGRLEGCAEDLHESPEDIKYIPDRARVIARDFGLDPSIVEQDIRGLLA